MLPNESGLPLRPISCHSQSPTIETGAFRLRPIGPCPCSLVSRQSRWTNIPESCPNPPGSCPTHPGPVCWSMRPCLLGSQTASHRTVSPPHFRASIFCVLGISLDSGMRLPLTGTEIPKIGKRGFRSKKKTPFPPPQKRGLRVNINPIFLVVLWKEMGIFDSERPFLGWWEMGVF